MSDIEDAKKLLEDDGYVVLRRRSHEATLRRLAIAQSECQWEKREAEHAREWARDCLAQERRLGDRCTFLYGMARSMGATDEQLRGAR